MGTRIGARWRVAAINWAAEPEDDHGATWYRSNQANRILNEPIKDPAQGIILGRGSSHIV
jgi:hypothetical protein